MSSATGWQPKQSSGRLSFGDEGWGAPSAVKLSSPLSHPEGWPQLGTQDPSMNSEMQQQPNQGFADSRQRSDSSGWGGPVSNNSNAPRTATGWGTPSATGWGGTNSGGNNWARHQQVDNGTALWGKQSQGSGGWGAPSSHWNTTMPSTASTGPIQPSAPSQEQEHVTQVMSVPPASAPTQQPETWAAAAAASPQPQGGQSANTAQQCAVKEVEPSQTLDQPQRHKPDDPETQDIATHSDANDQLQKLVNSHEGWGKRPILQNTSWDVSDSPSFPPPSNKTGTEAWGKTMPNQPISWQGPAGLADPNSQQWNKPTGNPVRGWGSLSTQTPPPPRPPWGGAQPTPPQTGWGNQRLPPPATAINSNRWSSPTDALAGQSWSNPRIQASGWSNSSSADNTAWGAGLQRNSQAPIWSATRPSTDAGWNQHPNMQRQPSLIDDGTSAWGDPMAYKNVSMWDKKPVVGVKLNASDQGKSESVGWGTSHGNQGLENKTSPTGWGDNNSSKPGVDDVASSWTKGGTNNGGSNWDQNASWAIGKNGGNGWSANTEHRGPQWGQAESEAARVKNKDFGFADRKASTGSDSVFEEGHLERSANGFGIDVGSGHSGLHFGQFPAAQPNNQGVPALNSPRPVPPQNLVNPSMQSLYHQGPSGPPMAPHVQTQLQQIRHAVMKGVIPQQILNPQVMTPQHLNLLQQLVMKTAEYQQLSAKMNVLSKPNLPPQLRPQQEQTARMLQQCQRQIQAQQRALTQSMMQKTTTHTEKGNMGTIGPNSGLSLDLAPVAGAMPPTNSGASPFSMSNISQSLPSADSSNREQHSRLHSWRRPSFGLDISSENTTGSALSSVISHPSISDMIGARSGLLTSPSEQGGLLGLQQLDSRTDGNEPSNEDLANRDRDIKDDRTRGLTKEMITGVDTDQEESNLNSILADIGPPEFIPGKKWKGVRPIDPENDPDITPGSVAIAKTMSVNTVKDVDQVLNRDRYAVSQVDNSSNSSGEIATIAKSQTSLASSFANIPNNDTSSAVSSTMWSTGSEWSENKTWVLLTNVNNAQMDFSNLRSLCSMKGKMISFQPNYPVRGVVLIRCQSADDAISIRNVLNTSFAGSSTFSASVLSDQEVTSFLNTSTSSSWNAGSVPRTRHSFGASGTLLSNHPQPNPNFGSAPVMPNSNIMYTPEVHPWSTSGSSGTLAPAHGHLSWSTGGNAGPGRPTGTPMWSNSSFTGYDDASNVVSPPHSLLPENLLGEQPL